HGCRPMPRSECRRHDATPVGTNQLTLLKMPSARRWRASTEVSERYGGEPDKGSVFAVRPAGRRSCGHGGGADDSSNWLRSESDNGIYGISDRECLGSLRLDVGRPDD